MRVSTTILVIFIALVSSQEERTQSLNERSVGSSRERLAEPNLKRGVGFGIGEGAGMDTIRRSTGPIFNNPEITDQWRQFQENEGTDGPIDGIDQILQHYHQIDFAPFVSTDKAKEEALNSIIKSAAKLIKSDQTEEAKRLFEGIKKPEILREIVKSAYDGDLLNTIKLIELLRSLDDKILQMRGFSALYDEMKRRRDMRNPAIIEVAYWMRHHVEDGDVALETDEFIERFLYFDTEKYSIVNEAMQIWGEKLRSGDSSQVLMVSKTYPGAFMAVVPKLIEATYSEDDSNFNAIMGFVRTTELTATLKERVLDALLTQMQRNHHLGTQKFETLKAFVSSTNFTALKKRIEIVSRSAA